MVASLRGIAWLSLLAGVLCAACEEATDRSTMSETRAVTSFGVVSLSAPLRVTVTGGPAAACEVEGEPAAVRAVETSLAGGRLYIGWRGRLALESDDVPHIRLTTPALRGVEVQGGGDVTIEGAHAPRFAVTAKDGGRIRLRRIETDRLAVTVSGAARLEADGTASAVHVDASDEAAADLGRVASRHGEVKTCGRARVTVRATEALRVRASDDSQVRYGGTPQLDSRTDGAATVAAAGADGAERPGGSPRPRASDRSGSPDAADRAGFADRRRRALASLPPTTFRDVTRELQLGFVHYPLPHFRELRARLRLPVGFAGGGVALEYFDDDEHPDLFLAGGGGGRLYRNVGGERFEDITDAVGLDLTGQTRAGYFVDYDNDGDQDLFLTFIGVTNRLFENRGGRLFDVTAAAGLDSGNDVTHCAAWFDMDGDGLLDVGTAAFGDWPNGHAPSMAEVNQNGQPNRLFAHAKGPDGRHTFADIALEAGVADPGWTQCVGAWDLDEDGRPDLVSVGDFGPAHIFRNVGARQFEDQALALLTAPVTSGMNFTLLDVDGDGRMEFWISEIDIDGGGSKLFRWSGGQAVDVRRTYAEPAALGWPWDVSAFDYENDGDLDVLVLNGTEDVTPGVPDSIQDDYALVRTFANTPNVFFLQEEGFLYDASGRVPLTYPGNSRSAAVADLDGDGDLDIVISDYDAPARVFRNEQARGHHWIRLRLRGTRSNRDAIGAKVTVRAGDRRQTLPVVAGTGFMSQDPKELHVGLGRWDGPVSVEVRWPTGKRQVFDGLLPDRRHVIVEEQAVEE